LIIAIFNINESYIRINYVRSTKSTCGDRISTDKATKIKKEVYLKK